MSPPARPDEDNLPPHEEDDSPDLLGWAVAGCALVLAYVALLALLRPTV